MSQQDANKSTPGASGDDAEGAGRKPARPMSDREVRSVSSVLIKEARKILKKHAQRIAPDPCEAIRESAIRLEQHRAAGAWSAAREEVEILDELLHQHASFARKGVVRELVENISIAVLVALALRSCFYEPFKIPSGSMMPTLRNGDHIFVNKFVYGVQVPFTTTVVGRSIGEIERGDVIVFRYPIDPSEDFIKRVIGLPGDVVRVDGSDVSVKRAGTEEFINFERRKLDEPCRDETGKQIVPRCTLYEENNGDRAYTVRYEPNFDPRTGGPAQRRGEWAVPEGQLLVMGDNRNHSHDSLAWTKVVEAVAADGVISVRDLRDLTPETLFKLTRPDATISADASYDHVLYFAEHRSPKHGVTISVWRDPTLGLDTIYDTVVAGFGAGAEALTLDSLFEGSIGFKTQQKKQAQVARASAAITSLTISEQGEDGFDAAIKLAELQAVIKFRCGIAACNSRELFARRISNLLDSYIKNPKQDARELEIGASHIRYSQHWTSRGRASDKFLDRSFTPTGAASGRASTLRLRAWRDTDEGEEFLRDAALRAVGSSTSSASAVAEDGIQRDTWLARDDEALTLISSYRTAGIAVMLECGRQLCADETRAYELARAITAKIPAAARDRRRLPELLVAADIGDWKQLPKEAAASSQAKYEFDRLRLDGTVRSERYSAGVWVQRVAAGEDAQSSLEALASGLHEVEPSAEIVDGGRVGATGSGGYGHVFAIPESSVVVRVDCSEGLCPTREDAKKLAARAAEKARDETNFIDPHAERPYPYVPRGNVKGRADRIWLPFKRFWLPIR